MMLSVHAIAEELPSQVVCLHMEESDNPSLVSARPLPEPGAEPVADVMYVCEAEALPYYQHRDQLRRVLVVGADETIACGAARGLGPDRDSVMAWPGVGVAKALAHLGDVFDRHARLEREMTRLVLADDLRGALALGSDVLGAPLALFDANMDCLDMAGTDLVRDGDPIWSDILQSRHATLDLVPQLRSDRALLGRIAADRRAFAYEFPRLGTRCLHANVYFGGVRLGCLCGTEAGRPITKRTTGLATWLASQVAEVLSRRAARLVEVSSFASLLDRCLGGALPDEAHLAYATSALGWAASVSYAVAVFEPSVGSSAGGLGLEAREVRSRLRSCHATERDGQVVAMWPVGGDGADDAALLSLARRLGLSCGVSAPVGGLAEVRDGVWMARAALRAGSSCEPESLVHQFERLTLEVMAGSLPADVPLGAYCLPEVRALWERDARGGTQYVLTLYRYLECGRSLKRAAEALFVHRNTLVYRLDRLRELVGRQLLDDRERTLQLMLSCWLLLR